MNIFFCYHLNKFSGWGTLSLNYISAFKKNNVIVFCNKANSQLKFKQYEVLRDPLKYLKNPFLIFIDSFKLIKIIKEIKNNSKKKISAHILVEPYVLFLIILNKFFKRKIFYCIGTYSNILTSSLKFRVIFRIISSLLTHLIFLSSYSKKMIINKIHVRKSCRILVLNPIIKLTTAITVKKKNKNKNFNIVSVGAIKERKGYHHLIEVMNILINKYKLSIILNIIGEVNERLYFENLKNKITNYKLEKNIFFTGKISDKRLDGFYKNCDVFALLSNQTGHHFEAFGIVYLEALAKGKQIIISKDSGGADIKKIDKRIFVEKPNSYMKISNFIKKIYNNKIIITPRENILIYKKSYENSVNIFNKFKNSFL